MSFTTTPRTLELFVKSLLSKALQVTLHRNAKTLSPSHVKQCILAESRFDFLRDLVKNIPDVTAAEERELMSREDSPTRLSDSTAPRRVVREDSNSSSSSDVRVQATAKDSLRRAVSLDSDRPRNETVTSEAIDLTKKLDDRPVVSANFYQETLAVSETQHKSVITLNPTYTSPQPSTSNYAGFKRVLSVPDAVVFPHYAAEASSDPVAPILNIDFSKNLAIPEIKLLDTAVASIVGVPKEEKKIHRQNSKKSDVKKVETAIPKPLMPPKIDIDHLNSGNLQIDEDYDT